ncbi:MAG: hypothetical protein ACMUIE_02240 [Thermoplasmatota archaeon]
MTEGEKKNKTVMIIILLVVAFVGLLLVTGGIIVTVLVITGESGDDLNTQEQVVQDFYDALMDGDEATLKKIVMDEEGNMLVETDPESFDDMSGEIVDLKSMIKEFRIEGSKRTDFTAENTGPIYLVTVNMTVTFMGVTVSEETNFEVAQNSDSGVWGICPDGFSKNIQPDQYEPNDSWEEAVMLNEGTLAGLNIDEENEEDWFKFNLTESADVRIIVQGDYDEDTQLYLYEAENVEFGWDYEYNDDRDDDMYSELDLSLEAGDYYIKVEGFDGKITEYEIILQIT